jgi:alpha-ketoglutarate-dependent taurine dioxygenase
MAVAPPRPAGRSLGSSFGRVVEAAGGAGAQGAAGGTVGTGAATLADLDPEEVGALFREHGALLFRGFAPERDEFVAFTEAHSRDFSTYQGGFFRDRQPVGGKPTLLTVTGSQEGFAIPLHGEMYYTARQPALLWFFCERPASAGGETTLCDGEEICARLSERARALFAGRRVLYRRRLPDGAWQQAFQTSDLAEVERHCRQQDTRLAVDARHGGITTEYLSRAVVPGRGGRPDTFINNVVALYLGELALKRGTAAETIKSLSGSSFPITVRMEDGSPVPGAVIKEIMALNQQCAALVSWRRGDVLMVDNTRVLHGRLAYSGQRDVYVRMAEGLAT